MTGLLHWHPLRQWSRWWAAYQAGKTGGPTLGGSRRWWSWKAVTGYTTAVILDVGLLAWSTLKGLDRMPSWAEGWSNVVIPLLAAGPPLTVFLFWRGPGVTRWYQKRARTDPHLRVPNAGSPVGSGGRVEVVGRDELCSMLMENVRSSACRPTVLVGGIGAGKTAVLVRLTELLAAKGVVPVGVRMRDAQKREDLDFYRLAFKRFEEEVNPRLSSGALADRIFRHLFANHRIVVLADGLEEALDGVEDRDAAIRKAVDDAAQIKLPVVVTSRPHDPLRYLDADITRLMPLGEAPVLEFVTAGAEEVERESLTRLVQIAEVAQSPVYLQIVYQIEQLRRQGRLSDRHKWLNQPSLKHGGAEEDRIKVQRWLLDTWRDLLVDGFLYEDYALNAALREITIEVLSALACIGLSLNSSEVAFAKLDERPFAPVKRKLKSSLEDLVKAALGPDRREQRLTVREWCVMATTTGTELGLVEPKENAARFRFSTLQAYLGSRYLEEALQSRWYVHEAPRGGKEYLMALELASRDELPAVRLPRPRAAVVQSVGAGVSHMLPAADGDEDADGPTDPAGRAWQGLRDAVLDPHAPAARSLQLFTAMLEIDAVAARPEHDGIVDEIVGRWDSMQSTTRLGLADPTLVENRVKLVERLGEAARLIVRRRPDGSRCDQTATYRGLFRIAATDPDRSVRLAATRQIADGRRQAFEHMGNAFPEWWEEWDRYPQRTTAAPGPLLKEADVYAWLASLMYVTLLESTSDTDVAVLTARDHLRTWVEDYLGAVDTRHPGHRPLISVEMALAEGFRLAANRRPTHVDVSSDHRATFVHYTETALKHSRFWFAQLALIQALTLLSLPWEQTSRAPMSGRGTDPGALVEHWLKMAGGAFRPPGGSAGHELHPLVREAGELAKLALLNGRPEPFIWVCEAPTMADVGSLPAKGAERHQYREWILPSAGWGSLTPRARRLLAEVVILLNLAERAGDVDGLNERLVQVDVPVLPPCLCRDRSALDVTRTVGSARASDPGSSCHDDCEIRLCPYPPVGEPVYRADIDESFCRHLSHHGKPPRYEGRSLRHPQGLSRRQYREFWAQMADRTRPGRRQARGAE